MTTKTYPTFGTQLAQNPNYGRPSPKRQRERLMGWKLSIQSWKLLRQIHAEIGNLSRQKSADEIEFELPKL